jgi:hypothetical protein
MEIQRLPNIGVVCGKMQLARVGKSGRPIVISDGCDGAMVSSETFHERVDPKNDVA